MILNKTLIIALGAVILIAAIQTYRLSSERTARAQETAKNEREWAIFYRTSADAAIQVSKITGDRIKYQQLEIDDAKKQYKQIEAVANDNAAVGIQLRKRIAYLTASSCPATSDTATATGSETAGASRDMLADVFRRLDEAENGIAEYADRSAVAGGKCERLYDNLLTGN